MTYIRVQNNSSEVSGRPSSDMRKILQIYEACCVHPLDQHTAENDLITLIVVEMVE